MPETITEQRTSVAEQRQINVGALTVRERRFVRFYLGDANGIGTVAAELAGYASDNRRALAVTAHRLMHRPRVRAALDAANPCSARNHVAADQCAESPAPAPEAAPEGAKPSPLADLLNRMRGGQ